MNFGRCGGRWSAYGHQGSKANISAGSKSVTTTLSHEEFDILSEFKSLKYSPPRGYIKEFYLKKSIPLLHIAGLARASQEIQLGPSARGLYTYFLWLQGGWWCTINTWSPSERAGMLLGRGKCWLKGVIIYANVEMQMAITITGRGSTMGRLLVASGKGVQVWSWLLCFRSIMGYFIFCFHSAKSPLCKGQGSITHLFLQQEQHYSRARPTIFHFLLTKRALMGNARKEKQIYLE